MAGSTITYSILTGAKGTPGSIATWMNNSQIVNDTPQILSEAQSWIYRRLRHWRMFPAPVTGTLTVGNDYLTPPADMLEPAFLLTTGQYFQEITQKTYQEVVLAWNYTGTGTTRVQQQPTIYYFDQSAIRFDSPPDQAYTYALLYFQQPADLSASNETNFLTQFYPRLLRLSCQAGAAEWLKDNGQGAYDRTYWDELAQDEIEKAQAESDRAKRATVAAMVLIGGSNQGNSAGFPIYGGGFG
jgi:hypothetical protein